MKPYVKEFLKLAERWRRQAKKEPQERSDTLQACADDVDDMLFALEIFEFVEEDDGGR